MCSSPSFVGAEERVACFMSNLEVEADGEREEYTCVAPVRVEDAGGEVTNVC